MLLLIITILALTICGGDKEYSASTFLPPFGDLVAEASGLLKSPET